jgi:hypothetical protein
MLKRGLFTLPVENTRAKMPAFTLLDAERCESGRIDMLGKHASRQRDRGFESHPLRHAALRVYCPLFIAVSTRYSGEIDTSSVECWEGQE